MRISMDKIFNIILGVLLAVWGVILIFDRGYISEKYRHYIDFGPYHYVFGLILFVCGGAILLSVVRRKTNNEARVLICPKCQDTFFDRDVSKNVCPNCNVVLEDVKGFYKRHPELK